MTKSAARILAIALWALGTAAHAQGPTQEPAAPMAKLNLTLEQRHVIKELIKDMKIEPAETPARVEQAGIEEVGDNLPQDAALRPVPGDISRKVPQIKTHRFLYTADRILIVDPKDNRVAEVIELKSD